LSRAFGFAPFSRRSLTTSKLPPAAWCSEVRPCLSLAFGSVPLSSSFLTFLTSPSLAASISFSLKSAGKVKHWENHQPSPGAVGARGGVEKETAARAAETAVLLARCDFAQKREARRAAPGNPACATLKVVTRSPLCAMSSVGRVAYVVSYRRGSNSQNERYMLLEIEGVNSDSEAARFVGRKVLWRSPDGRLSVKGIIVRVHGCKGRVVARFRKPLPGQAIGTRALIL